MNQTSWNAKGICGRQYDHGYLTVDHYWVCGLQVINGDLTIGTMAAFIAYIDRLYSPLRRLVNSSTTLTQSIASMDRVFEFMDEKYDIDDEPGAIPCQNVKGDIQFNQVSFQYEAEEETSVEKSESGYSIRGNGCACRNERRGEIFPCQSDPAIL